MQQIKGSLDIRAKNFTIKQEKTFGSKLGELTVSSVGNHGKLSMWTHY